jgi:transforming growth factor-beta-induced protein
MPLYSTYATDGMVLQSLQGGNVTVALVDGDIYFNDAKVISPNVLTNNGLIHVLDKVMSPNGTAPAATATTTSTATTTTTTGTGTATGSSTASTTPVSSNAAVPVAADNAVGGLLAFMAAAAVLL